MTYRPIYILVTVGTCICCPNVEIVGGRITAIHHAKSYRDRDQRAASKQKTSTEKDCFKMKSSATATKGRPKKSKVEIMWHHRKN